MSTFNGTIPLGNRTALNHEIVYQWMPNAQIRGTSDILYTCVVTIILCVWTSIHMNIPAASEPKSKRLWRKIKWTSCALLAPEVVLFTAWSQYNAAKDLVKYLNEKVDHHRSKNTLKSEVQGPFSLRYGFFVVMGGFRVPDFRVDDTSQLVIMKPDVMRVFPDYGRFVSMEDRDISDRSKADDLAKLLICTQVAWLSIECIARKIMHLPLTILEIHTFIHVFCALAIYIVWWKKPLDIMEGAIAALSAEDQELLSFIQLIGSFSTTSTYEKLPVESKGIPLATGPFNFCIKESSHTQGNHRDLANLPAVSMCQKVTYMSTYGTGQQWKVQSYTIGGSQQVGLRILVTIRRYHTQSTTVPSDGSDQHPSTYDECLCELPMPEDASSLVRQQAYRAWMSIGTEDINFKDWAAKASSKRERAKNFSNLHWSFFSATMEMLILMAYGGVHLSAWNSHFPTTAEMWLWRASALLLAGTTPLLLGMTIPAILAFVVFYKLEEYNEALGSFVGYICLALFGGLVALYAFARCFLVVESFISLRSVPVGVYSAIPWSNYMPHL